MVKSAASASFNVSHTIRTSRITPVLSHLVPRPGKQVLSNPTTSVSNWACAHSIRGGRQGNTCGTFYFCSVMVALTAWLRNEGVPVEFADDVNSGPAGQYHDCPVVYFASPQLADDVNSMAPGSISIQLSVRGCPRYLVPTHGHHLTRPPGYPPRTYKSLFRPIVSAPTPGLATTRTAP
eukprot:scaffold430892_cov28-Prasinocladus_malaysianus.AAC.1